MSSNQDNALNNTGPLAQREQDHARDTDGVLRAAKLVMLGGWLAPILPVLGMLLLALSSTVVMVLTIFVMAKGNVRGGVTWFLVNIVGGLVVLLVWSGIYMAMAAWMGR